MKKNLIMVEGSNGLARDVNTGAIVNINKEEINAAREAKKRRKNKDAEFEQLKNEVGEMKELLNKLVEKL
jgi:uncharacterized protein YpuA (DUF1002 family)